MMPDDDDFSVFGETEPGDGISSADSDILLDSSADPNLLTFVREGQRAVVSFNSKSLLDEVCIAAYLDQLLKFIKSFDCQVLAFDLTGIKILPSGMLGVLVTLNQRGVKVELLNPIPDIVDVLRITHLAPMFSIRATVN